MLVLLFVVCGLGFAARIFLPAGLDGAGESFQAVLDLRLISAFTALIVGAALSSSGVYLQSLLRNPLASPYILGLAAGAGLGVGVSMLFGRSGSDVIGAGSFFSSEAGAVVGALLVLIVVYMLSQKGGLIDPVSLLLVGVMVSAICGALIMLIEFLSPASDTNRLIRWMMGTISQLTEWKSIYAAGVICALGIVIGMVYSRMLDVSVLSDDEARTLGVNVDRMRLVLFVVSGILTATAVVLTGPIGFVGLVGPHVARLVVGPRHLGLLIGSVLVGGALVLFADTGVRMLPRAHGLMPIGIVTAGIGGPVFIWLLRRERRFSK